jgi:hypothetical protein
MLNPVKNNYCSQQYFNNLISVIENDLAVKKFLYELETRIITHNLRDIPKTEEYLNQEIISQDWFDGWLTEVLENIDYMFTNGINYIQLWDESSVDNLKICIPELAVNSFISMTGIKITSNKLFRRLKDKTRKFGYELNNPVSNICGVSKRQWEFNKLITNNTQITNITLNSGALNSNNLGTGDQSVNSVIED